MGAATVLVDGRLIVDSPIHSQPTSSGGIVHVWLLKRA
jgi:hypothetical protein